MKRNRIRPITSQTILKKKREKKNAKTHTNIYNCNFGRRSRRRRLFFLFSKKFFFIFNTNKNKITTNANKNSLRSQSSCQSCLH